MEASNIVDMSSLKQIHLPHSFNIFLQKSWEKFLGKFVAAGLINIILNSIIIPNMSNEFNYNLFFLRITFESELLRTQI
jgi:hypothetical protein